MQVIHTLGHRVTRRGCDILEKRKSEICSFGLKGAPCQQWISIFLVQSLSDVLRNLPDSQIAAECKHPSSLQQSVLPWPQLLSWPATDSSLGKCVTASTDIACFQRSVWDQIRPFFSFVMCKQEICKPSPAVSISMSCALSVIYEGLK